MAGPKPREEGQGRNKTRMPVKLRMVKLLQLQTTVAK